MSKTPATLQNVNLYLPEFRKKKHWLDAEKMIVVFGVTVALLLVASAVEYWQLTQLRGDLAYKKQVQEQSLAATQALLDEYGAQTEDPALLSNIRELEEDLQSKQALLEFLEGRELGNSAGFSEHLADLSRYHVQGLSLSGVTLSDGGRSVELSGQVLKAELVPIYLQNLSKGRSYAGKNFEMLQIDEEPVEVVVDGEENVTAHAEVWNFEVRTLDQSVRSIP